MTRIVFFGNERLSSAYVTEAPTLRALIAASYEVTAVVANHTVGRSRQTRDLEVQAVADEYGIPVLLPERPVEILEALRAMRPDVGVLVAYGRIVPQSIIDIFPSGILNIHPSLLPLHRGSIPIEAAILDGDTKTGVSIMQLVKAMDAGPVYRQAELMLRGDETKQELTTTLLTMGKDALLACLPGVLDGSLQPAPQDDSQATYDALLQPSDSLLDASKPAIRLEREVRAYAGWPKSRLKVAGRDCVVTQASAKSGLAGPTHHKGDMYATEDKRIALQTSDGILVIERLVPAGKSEMPASAFLAGNTL